MSSKLLGSGLGWLGAPSASPSRNPRSPCFCASAWRSSRGPPPLRIHAVLGTGSCTLPTVAPAGCVLKRDGTLPILNAQPRPGVQTPKEPAVLPPTWLQLLTCLHGLLPAQAKTTPDPRSAPKLTLSPASPASGTPFLRAAKDSGDRAAPPRSSPSLPALPQSQQRTRRLLRLVPATGQGRTSGVTAAAPWSRMLPASQTRPTPPAAQAWPRVQGALAGSAAPGG